MKKSSIKNILIVSVLITSFFTGNFIYSDCCETEECFSTECCSENLTDSGFQLSTGNANCCEYNQAIGNKIQAVSTFNSNIKSNITNQSIIPDYIRGKHDCSYCLKEIFSHHIPESHSIFILRI